MKHDNVAKYKNVQICPLSEEHIEDLRQWRNNPQNTQFLKKIPYITEEMQKKWYDSYLKNDDEIAFAIIETDTLKRMVGSISLLNFEANRVECGHIMVGVEEAHGMHICENAINAVLKIVFEKFGLEEVILHVFKEHQKAIYVYQKVGFEVLKSYETEYGVDLLMLIGKDRVHF